MLEINNIEFKLLREYLFRISGIDIPDSKKYLFTTRLSAFLDENKLDNFSELYFRLTRTSNEKLERTFLQAMTIHESSFFRDESPYKLLEKSLLPTLALQRSSAAKMLAPRIRILSAGCSIGQEPYSIAMIIKDWVSRQSKIKAEDITIMGIDISEKALGKASEGKYLPLELGQKVPILFKKHFLQDGDFWVVGDEIKKMVRFSHVNLSKPFRSLGKFDIIFCRNVVIYFPLKTKQQILSGFHEILNPDGALILGSTENLYGISNAYTSITEHGCTYYRPADSKK